MVCKIAMNTVLIMKIPSNCISMCINQANFHSHSIAVCSATFAEEEKENWKWQWRHKIMNFDIVFLLLEQLQNCVIQMLEFVSNGITFKSKWDTQWQRGDEDEEKKRMRNCSQFVITWIYSTLIQFKSIPIATNSDWIVTAQRFDDLLYLFVLNLLRRFCSMLIA